jgi:enterochelin esterase-like enzyme
VPPLAPSSVTGDAAPGLAFCAPFWPYRVMLPRLVGLLVLAFTVVRAAEAPPVIWNNVPASARPGLEHHSFTSTAMGREIGYTVALPSSYHDGPKRFPVVYFLHGMGGNENSDGPGFSQITTFLATHGHLPPIICVFPNGGRSGYRDLPDDKVMVETMLIQELVPLIDRTFRTLPQRDSRAIAGFSMGGGGAVRLALTYPQLFAAAGSWAGAFGRRGRESGLPPELSVERLRESTPRVRLLLIVGYDDESTYASHAPFLQALTEAKYPYTFHPLAGVGHNLGLLYRQTGEEMARFVVRELATELRAGSKTP